MEIWIAITLMAAFTQNIRSGLQKHLTGVLSTAGATQVRFIYAIAFVALYLLVLCSLFGYSLPSLHWRFWSFAALGGVSQILATALLVKLFSYRNFFIGTIYSKIETIQAAIIGFLLLGDSLSWGAWLGIILGVAGVVLISSAKGAQAGGVQSSGFWSPSAMLGIASGFLFGVAAVSFRAASISLAGGELVQAAFTLFCVLLMQSGVMLIYLRLTEPGQMTKVFKHWRLAWLVGLTGGLASIGWFTAMTMANAGLVRAVGQVELVFAFALSVLVFKERSNWLEVLGVLTIVVGIVILLIFR